MLHQQQAAARILRTAAAAAAAAAAAVQGLLDAMVDVVSVRVWLSSLLVQAFRRYLLSHRCTFLVRAGPAGCDACCAFSAAEWLSGLLVPPEAFQGSLHRCTFLVLAGFAGRDVDVRSVPVRLSSLLVQASKRSF
jgi:hypothetical protein